MCTVTSLHDVRGMWRRCPGEVALHMWRQLLRPWRDGGTIATTVALCAGAAFGAIVAEPAPGPWEANQTVSATFQSACPRNSLGRRASFLTVERASDGGGGGWDVVPPTPPPHPPSLPLCEP